MTLQKLGNISETLQYRHRYDRPLIGSACGQSNIAISDDLE